jgi:hypothetical protein
MFSLIIMRDNFSINIISVTVDSLISDYIVIKGSRPSRKLKIVRFSFDRGVSETNIFIKNTFNDVNISNCGYRKCRICRIKRCVSNAGCLLILIWLVCTVCISTKQVPKFCIQSIPRQILQCIYISIISIQLEPFSWVGNWVKSLQLSWLSWISWNISSTPLSYSEHCSWSQTI